MADLLKNMYNTETIREFAENIKANYDSFKVDEFIKSIMDETWEALELKARGRRITVNLKKYLPGDYVEAIKILDKVAPTCTRILRNSFIRFCRSLWTRRKELGRIYGSFSTIHTILFV